MTLKKFKAYHSNEQNVIGWALKLEEPYKSTGNSHWLGDGSYFFEESPKGKSHAENWGKNHKKMPGIIEAEIEVEEEKLLDLTDPKKMDMISDLQEKFSLLLLEKAGIDYEKNTIFIDGLFFNMWDTITEGKQPIDVIKKRDFYPFLELPKKIKSRVPNALVLCVRNKECIKNMKEV